MSIHFFRKLINKFSKPKKNKDVLREVTKEEEEFDYDLKKEKGK